MALNDRLHRVLSLSAASMALLQSAVIVKGQPVELASISPNGKSKDGIQTKAGSLILEPPHQKVLLYADHTSHASHDSHSSHYSGTDSGGYDYSTPATTPTYPVSPPPPPPPPPPPVPETTNATTAAGNIDFVPDSTNSVVATNSAESNGAAKKAVDMAALTKQAATGDDYAQVSLGLDYLYGGDGVKQDTDRAKLLFELASAQGNSFAKKKLEQLNQQDTQTNSPPTP